jgi:hypothetical protein
VIGNCWLHDIEEDLGLIAKRGRVLIIGSRGTITIDPRAIMATDAHVIGVQLGSASYVHHAVACIYCQD